MLRQHRAWLLSRTLYQLNNSRLVKCKCKQGAVMLLYMIILSLQTRVPILHRNKTKQKQKTKQKRRRRRRKEEEKKKEEEETSHCRAYIYSCERALYSDIIWKPQLCSRMVAVVINHKKQASEANQERQQLCGPPHTLRHPSHPTAHPPHNSAH